MSSHTLMIRKKCLYQSDTYLIQADITHTGSRSLVHTQRHIKRPLPTCSAGLPNYHQLLYINKPWHKGGDESAIPNTLQMLPRVACYRPSGQIGRRGEWEGRGVSGKLEGDREKVRDTQLITSYMETYEDEERAGRTKEKMTALSNYKSSNSCRCCKRERLHAFVRI